MGQRLVEAPLPANRHEERREGPDRHGGIARQLSDGESPARRRLACTRVTRVGAGPALLPQHWHLFPGVDAGAIGEPGLRDGDHLGRSILEGEGGQQREAQRGVHLVGVPAREHGLRAV
jgi:hypothetical protein